MSTRNRTQYSSAFKRRVFNAVKDGLTVAKASSKFDVPKARVYDWVRAIDAEEEGIDQADSHKVLDDVAEASQAAELFPSVSEQTALENNLKRLEAEFRLLKDEYDALKSRYIDTVAYGQD